MAIATLRFRGFDGQVVVLDLDAHPPDGTAACLEHDERAWVGSLSGSHWGAIEGLRGVAPKATIVENVRFIDDAGQVIVEETIQV